MTQKWVFCSFSEAFTGHGAGFAGGGSLDRAIQLSALPCLLIYFCTFVSNWQLSFLVLFAADEGFGKIKGLGFLQWLVISKVYVMCAFQEHMHELFLRWPKIY